MMLSRWSASVHQWSKSILALHSSSSWKHTHPHKKPSLCSALRENLMLAFIHGDLRWGKVTSLADRSQLLYAVSTPTPTCYIRARHIGRKGGNSLWAFIPKGHEKFTLEARSISCNRQTAAGLITCSIRISLFYLPPWIEAEGLTASDYFPRGDSWRLAPLLTLSWIGCYWLLGEFPDYIFLFISVIMCILFFWCAFPPIFCYRLSSTVNVLHRNPSVH